MFRYLLYLRIAFSVACEIAYVLLIVLWVRSYEGVDSRSFLGPYNRRLLLVSLCGEVGITSIHGMRDRSLSPRKLLEWEKSPHYPYSRINRSGFRHLTGRQPPYRADFRWNTIGSRWYISVPYWFLTLCAVVLGAAAWIRPSRRFSLRTLLIASTLSAILMAIIVAAIR